MFIFDDMWDAFNLEGIGIPEPTIGKWMQIYINHLFNGRVPENEFFMYQNGVSLKRLGLRLICWLKLGAIFYLVKIWKQL